MPEEKQEPTYAEIRSNISRELSKKLSATFDEIAKIAIRASAEFSETTGDPDVPGKIQKAHSMVTLIIDDAMRGLGESANYALGTGVLSVLEEQEKS